jgi:hypothetical protein
MRAAVTNEKARLDERIAVLALWVNSPDFYRVDVTHARLLTTQLHLMRGYSTVLAARLELVPASEMRLPPQAPPVDRDSVPDAKRSDLISESRHLVRAIRAGSFVLAEMLEQFGTHVEFDRKDFKESDS